MGTRRERWIAILAVVVLWLTSGCTILRVSVSSDGSQLFFGGEQPTISADGAVIAFVSIARIGSICDAFNGSGVYVHVLATGTTECVSVDGFGLPSNGAHRTPRLSADGRFVVYESTAQNVLPGCTDPNTTGIFLKDRVTGSLECVNVGTATSTQGGMKPAISGDGRFVAYVARGGVCTLLVRDRQLGVTSCASMAPDGSLRRGDAPSLSADGRFVAFASPDRELDPGSGCATLEVEFPGDSIFVRDLQLGVTTCVSVATGGAPGGGTDPKISADGRFVAFESNDSDLVPGCAALGRGGIFVHDRAIGTTTCASVNDGGAPADRDAFDPSISGNGRFVAFHSLSGTLDPDCPAAGYRHVFVHDRTMSATRCISRQALGAPANGDSRNPALSGNGLVVAFESDATNLIASDTNGMTDVLVAVLAATPPSGPRTDYDFDGDGRADIGVFRQSTGEWFVFGSTTGFSGPVLFGAPGLGDVPIPADYDGDGRTDLAVFRTSTAEWFIFGSATGFPGPVLFGSPGLGDLPVPADYDGDGKADLAIYRPSTSEWLIFGSTIAFPGKVVCGVPGLGGVPVPADYDGDGKADLAVYQPATARYQVCGALTGSPGPILFGAPGLGDVPLVADFDGDRKSDLGVFRRSTGEWFIFRSATGFLGPVLFGAPGLGDVPVPADYDGDGKADLAVYRTSTAEYFIFGSATGFPGPVLFGAPGLGDIPLNRPTALR